MKTTSRAKQKIKEFEGLRLEAYMDAGGTITIGYGHTGNVGITDKITLQEAERLFENDVLFVENSINKYNLKLTQNQFDALVSFTFNVGVGTFQKAILPLIQTRGANDISIPLTMAKYVYSNGTKLPGLVVRREWETSLYVKKEFNYLIISFILIALIFLAYVYFF
jgi:lysozyme